MAPEWGSLGESPGSPAAGLGLCLSSPWSALSGYNNNGQHTKL